ncbi:MAG: rhodanese-like domain-containing protein [bacterium]|nr:rhodanese-like domain-containing protein [bacterium]MDT8285060.1 rhodanese-like domain-containing protein [Thermovirgaceae bacterium]
MRVNLIKPDELEKTLEADPTFLIIDIRDDDVYSAMRLPYENVLHLPLAYLEEKLSEIPEGKKLIIACHYGKQSITAVPYLSSKGYDVQGCLDGGIMGWQKAGKPVRN